MVFVPAGEFLMGSVAGDSNADDNQFPQHVVYLELLIMILSAIAWDNKHTY